MLPHLWGVRLAFLSQSTIGGHQGSNAYTVISLLLAKTYLTNKSSLQLKNYQPLTPSWILAFMSCMMGGNQAYDSFMQSPSYLGVVEAIPLVRSSLYSLSYEEELKLAEVKVKISAQPILVLNKSVFPMAMYCFCRCFLYPRTECIT